VTISAFTFCRNAASLYYPIEASIRSALPLVDEVVVALGRGDDEDDTRSQIEAIGDPKIKIIDTEWDVQAFPKGTVHAQQTDLAKSNCSGDWLIYLQADEVLHQDDWATIKNQCQRYLNDEQVEGMLFDYHHFWGDYQHLVEAHGWYPKEIRLIRNRKDIHSWESAQSFRSIPDFDGRSYRKKEGSRKLRVVDSGARIFHYGWVRPPAIMTKKMQAMDRNHGHPQPRFKAAFEYGDLSILRTFQGSHPDVMTEWIRKMDWSAQLDLLGMRGISRTHRFKHERWKYRLLHLLEKHLFGGKQVFAYQNYTRIN
jgi:hypothetical protein